MIWTLRFLVIGCVLRTAGVVYLIRVATDIRPFFKIPTKHVPEPKQYAEYKSEIATRNVGRFRPTQLLPHPGNKYLDSD